MCPGRRWERTGPPHDGCASWTCWMSCVLAFCHAYLVLICVSTRCVFDQGEPTSRRPVGWDPSLATASKSGGGSGGTGGGGKKKRPIKPKPPSHPEASLDGVVRGMAELQVDAAGKAAPAVGGGGNCLGRRVRALEKRLRQIQELEARDRTALTPEQREKLGRKAALQEGLMDLQSRNT